MSRIFSAAFSSAFIVGVSAVAATSSAESLPILKTGMWEIEATMPGAPGGKMAQRLCVDEQSQTNLANNAKAATSKACSAPSTTQSGNVWTTVSTCKFSTKETTSKTVLTMADSEHYSTETTFGESGKVSATGTFKGPCPADMKPGDMQASNGQKINTQQLGEMLKAGRANKDAPK